MAKTIFVSGATGNSGKHAVRSLRERGIEVVAGVHSPEKAAELEALGATVRPFDLADASAMGNAMRGAEGLYLVTPVSERTAEMTATMVEAAKAAGVRHVVKLSGLDVDKEPSFTLGQWHLAAEQVVRACGLDWTFLRANAFMENFLGSAGTIKAQGAYYSPYGSAPVAFIAAKDIGDVAASVLAAAGGHGGKTYNLTGPEGLANDEVARLLSRAAGKPVETIPVTEAQLRDALTGHGMLASEAGAIAELMSLMSRGIASYVTRDVEVLLGRPGIGFEQWTRDFETAFR